MTKIGVTGATGLIGRVLVRLLITEGHEVRTMARHPEADDDPVLSVGGDVRDASAADRLLEGCDVVIHLAPGIAGGEDVADAVVEGTSTICRAAENAGTSRIVYLSCQGVHSGAHQTFLQAKWTAETIVAAASIPHVILRSSLVVGQGGVLVSGLRTLLQRLPVLPVPGRGDSRFQPIDVQDVARCLMLAATGDLDTQTVSVGGPVFMTYRQLADLGASELGVSRPKLLVPMPLVSSVLGLLPADARPLFTQPWPALLTGGVVASPGVVEKHFGFQPASILPTLSTYMR